MPMSDVTHARPKIIGARVKRTEDPRLLTGRGSFVDDRQGSALHVAFRRSEHAHARIVSADCTAARARGSGGCGMRRKPGVGMEPRGCLAEYDAGRDALILYSATQIPGMGRDALSEALDLRGPRLRVIALDVGGGFGGKGSLYPE